MKFRIAPVALMFAALAAGYQLRPLLPGSGGLSYAQARAEPLAHLAAQFGHADTLVIGDSLVEWAMLDEVCGRTFNAGLSGARIEDIAAAAPRLIAATSPETVVVVVGTNDFRQGVSATAFEQGYARFLESLGERRLVLAGLHLSEQGDAVVRKLARETGAAFVEPVELIGPDGIHHTVEGSIAFRRGIAAACAGLNEPGGRFAARS